MCRVGFICNIMHALQAYEFVDTLIMILKKNNRQISFLHVYHHATTVRTPVATTRCPDMS